MKEKKKCNPGAVLDMTSEENAESHIQTDLASDLTVTFHKFLPTLYGFSLLGICGCQKVRGCSAFCSQALKEEMKKHIAYHSMNILNSAVIGLIYKRNATDRWRFVSLHCLSLPQVVRSVIFLFCLFHFIPFIVFIIIFCILLLLFFFTMRI